MPKTHSPPLSKIRDLFYSQQPDHWTLPTRQFNLLDIQAELPNKAREYPCLLISMWSKGYD